MTRQDAASTPASVHWSGRGERAAGRERQCGDRRLHILPRHGSAGLRPASWRRKGPPAGRRAVPPPDVHPRPVARCPAGVARAEQVGVECLPWPLNRGEFARPGRGRGLGATKEPWFSASPPPRAAAPPTSGPHLCGRCDIDPGPVRRTGASDVPRRLSRRVVGAGRPGGCPLGPPPRSPVAAGPRGSRLAARLRAGAGRPARPYRPSSSPSPSSSSSSTSVPRLPGGEPPVRTAASTRLPPSRSSTS